MKHVYKPELTVAETRIIAQLKQHRREARVAHAVLIDLVRVAVIDLGLPCRTVGEAAGFSAAHVSRLTKGRTK